MSLKPNLLKLGISLAVICLFFTFFFSSSDKELILKVMGDVQRLADISPGEKPFEVLERTSKLLKHFEESVLIEYPSAEDRSQSEQRVVSLKEKRKIREQSIAAAKFFKELRFDFREIEVQLQGDTATLTLLVNAVGSLPGEEDVFLESHRYEIGLSKQSGTWRIGRAKHLSNERE